MEGWVAIPRQIMDTEFYFSERFTKSQAWIDLILLATFKARMVEIRGIKVHLEPGELCYSQESLARRWQWNPKTVRSLLCYLEELQMVETKTDNVTTIISIKHWSLFQPGGHPIGEQMVTKMVTNNNVNNVKKHDDFALLVQLLTPIFIKRGLAIRKEQLLSLRKEYMTYGMDKMIHALNRLHDWMEEGNRPDDTIAYIRGILHNEFGKSSR